MIKLGWVSDNLTQQLFSFCAGGLFAFAFAPFELSYLAIIALLMLFYVCQHSTPKQALWRGYLFGLGQFGLGVSWVFVSMHSFGKVGVAVAGLMTLLFATFWAIFPALAAYLWRKLSGWQLLTMPVIWLLVEFLRGYWVLNGFPWLQIGYSQLDSPLAGYVPIVGVYGTGFIAALSASFLLGLLAKAQRVWLVVSLLLLWTAGVLLKTQSWTQPIGAPFSVALIQGNIAQNKKWLPEYKANTLLLYKNLTEQNWDAQLIIWPETSVPAYLSDVYDFFLLPLNQAAQQQQTDLLVSLPIKNAATGEKFNGVLTLGSKMAEYRKQHLLPFGETMPWQPLSGFVLQQLGMKLGDFSAGADDQALLSAAGFPLHTSICYEDVFSIPDLGNAAYLVNVSNDGWFGDSIEPHQHAQIARARALETGRYLLRATNTGLTVIVDPAGKITQQLPLFTVAVLRGFCTPMGGLTPYSQLGDMPILAFLLVLLALSIFQRDLAKVVFRLTSKAR